MIVRFLGHAAFSIEAASLRLCLDPHRPGALNGRFQLPPIQGPFDAVAISHSHEDHAGWTPALGTDRIIETDTTLDGVALTFRTVPHDGCCGTQSGFSRLIKIAAGGHTVVHCGDIGAWDSADIQWLGAVDLLLVPVGGVYTIDAPLAIELVAQCKPRWVMPMHAADPRVDLPLEPVDRFLDHCDRDVVRLAELNLADPPTVGTTVLLAGP